MPEYRLSFAHSRRCFDYVTIEADDDVAAANMARSAAAVWKPKNTADRVWRSPATDLRIILQRGPLGGEGVVGVIEPNAAKPYRDPAVLLVQEIAELRAADWHPDDTGGAVQTLDAMIAKAREICGLPASRIVEED